MVLASFSYPDSGLAFVVRFWPRLRGQILTSFPWPESDLIFATVNPPHDID